MGSLNESIAHPREIFRAAIATGAHAMVLLHNHPSGYPQPSAADRCLTQRLRDAADLLQIKLLDHIIVGQQRLATAANIKVSNSRRPPSSRIRAAEKPSLGDYFSFAEAGEI
ncbi:MAG: JAB domain-containing protein [Chthoniobacterales bacterium]